MSYKVIPGWHKLNEILFANGENQAATYREANRWLNEYELDVVDAASGILMERDELL